MFRLSLVWLQILRWPSILSRWQCEGYSTCQLGQRACSQVEIRSHYLFISLFVYHLLSFVRGVKWEVCLIYFGQICIPPFHGIQCHFILMIAL